ncbi:hypothetical protein GCM10027347_57710 [Larkinella harenae]
MTGDQRPPIFSNTLNQRLDVDFALQASGLGLWELDPETHRVIWDDRCRQLFGIENDTFLSYDQAIQYIHPDDVDRVDQAVQRAVNATSDGHYDQTYRTIGAHDGQLRTVRFQGKAYFSATGKLDRFAGIAQDLTSQQVDPLEESLLNVSPSPPFQRIPQADPDWLTTIFEQAPVAIALLQGEDYRLKMANTGMYEIWQLPKSHPSVLGQPVFKAFPGIANLGLEELLAEVRQTGQPIKGHKVPAQFERDGGLQTAYINFIYAPIYTPDGTIDIVVVASDVTELALAQQQTEENEINLRALSDELTTMNDHLSSSNEEYAAVNEKLEEANGLLLRSNNNLQTFAYVASHDLQEPLRKIQSFGDVLKDQYGSELGAGADLLERMQAAANRMSVLIKDLLSFSRISTQQNTSGLISLESIVDQVLGTLELTIQETGAQVIVKSLPTVMGDTLQLGQLFQNLLSNALKFRRPAVTPHLLIQSTTLPFTSLPDSVKPSRTAHTYHCIEVVDNGIGFDEKYADRIFQVFQRLHGRNEFAGSGIGLSICEKVVANHGGAITARSKPGQGATFTVYLPA